MAEPIRIAVEFTGTDDAVRGTTRVSDGLENMSDRSSAAARATDQLAARQTAAATAAIAFGQRVAAAGAAVQGLMSALGVEGQAAGLIGKITQTSTAMAQLGATLGPQGALVGGILGAAVPAMVELFNATERQAEAARDAARAAEEERVAQEALTDRILSQFAARRQVQSLMRGEGYASPESARQAAASAATTISDLEGMVERIRRTGEQLGVDTSERVRALEDRIARERGLLAGATQAEERLVSAAEVTPAARRGGGGRRPAQQEEGAPSTPSSAETLYAEMLAEENEYLRQQADLQEYLNELGQQSMSDIEAHGDLRQKEHEAEMERLDEQKDKARDVTDAQREHMTEWRSVYQQAGQVLLGGMNESIKAIQTGSKTAEEAFAGLLASFLKFISEQAMIKAAYEFASAIESFAGQKYDQGALHIAAGLLYTGIAVAAGAGSTALAPPPSAGGKSGDSKPAAPESGRGDGDKGGGDIVINWNSPVVTAGTRAELGRDMAGMIRAGTQRYGTV